MHAANGGKWRQILTLDSRSSSSAPQPANGGGTRLDSWKQIAAYLDRDVRTVERWAQHKGLPVHRVAGARGQSVFAFTGELDEWLRKPAATQKDAEQPESPRSWRVPAFVAAALMAVLALVVTVALGFRNSAGPIHSVRVTGRDIVALDASGRAVWAHQDEPLLLMPASWVGEPDRPGAAAIIVGGDVQTSTQSKGLLTGFSRTGTQLWRVTPQDTFGFVGGRLGPPWGSQQFLVYRADGAIRIAWAVHHHTWWPSILVVLDNSGRPVDRFVNAGWITRIALAHDATHLLIAGVSQEFNGVMFAVLDARHASGSSPTAGDSPFACLDCPAGRPLRYYVLPYPELSVVGDRGPVQPVVNVFDSGAIELRVPPGRDALPGAEIIWEISSTFDIETAGASGPYWDWHRRAEAQGLVKHRAEVCPERRVFAVREWTAQAGWRTLAVPVRATTSR